MDSLHCMHPPHSPQQRSIVRVGHVPFGGPDVVMVAGPCAVESLEQLIQVAETLVALGIPCMRGGAFKPRTSPYAFQGMGLEGLELLAAMRERYGLAIISEVMSPSQADVAETYLDCFQVGARNMQNFELLKHLGRKNKPVLLKRGLTATLEEFLMAAEYLMAEGNSQVILCERGIRSYDPETRNVLDLAAVARLRELTHLPVVVDPSHATGRRTLVAPTSLAAVAVGADGLLVEAHPVPEESVSDAEQALSLPDLAELMPRVTAVARAVDRGMVKLSTEVYV